MNVTIHPSEVDLMDRFAAEAMHAFIVDDRAIKFSEEPLAAQRNGENLAKAAYIQAIHMLLERRKIVGDPSIR